MAIARILRAHGMTVDASAEVEDAVQGAEPPAVVVTWANDPSSSASLARVVGPLTQQFERAPLIVVCEAIERWGIRAALASGACGVVIYDQLDRAFSACLQAVIAGQTCVPQMHSRQIEPPALSTREKQILGLVVMGHTNSQIAARLFLAESTVKSHLSSAFGKMGVRSRNEAVKLILDPENGLGLGILALGGEPVDRVSA
jgi:DNA-binding NarL/FixJ family response regulator